MAPPNDRLAVYARATGDTSERLDETAAQPLVEDPEAVFAAVFGTKTFAMGDEAFADGHLKS